MEDYFSAKDIMINVRNGLGGYDKVNLEDAINAILRHFNFAMVDEGVKVVPPNGKE